MIALKQKIIQAIFFDKKDIDKTTKLCYTALEH